jgi:hypothetical protein
VSALWDAVALIAAAESERRPAASEVSDLAEAEHDAHHNEALIEEDDHSPVSVALMATGEVSTVIPSGPPTRRKLSFRFPLSYSCDPVHQRQVWLRAGAIVGASALLGWVVTVLAR